ncbi:MAG: Gfo/Idh/MocA family oxidoreductase [Ignavibacteriaceae bacterium]
MLSGAIIGFGKIAQNSHIPALPDLYNRGLNSKKFTGIKFYKSITDLFNNEKLDFVDITSPPLFHAEIIETAIKNNVNIICEKPFTFNLYDADKVSAKLKNKKLVFMPCHQYKYAPLWKKFKEFIDESEENSKFVFQSSVYRTEADFGLQVLNNPWRIKKEISGGGILTDTGIHYLYLANWLVGKPKKLTAKIFNLRHNYSVEDTGCILLEYEKGIAEITLTWASGVRANFASITSKHGNLIYSGKSELIKNLNNCKEKISIPDISDKTTYNSLYVALFEEFIENLKNNNNSSLYIDEALDSIFLLEKCYESAYGQKTIFLND